MVGVRFSAGQGILEAAAGSSLPLAEPLPEEPVEPPDDALAHGAQSSTQTRSPSSVASGPSVASARARSSRNRPGSAWRRSTAIFASATVAPAASMARRTETGSRKFARYWTQSRCTRRRQQARVHAAVLDEREQGAHELARGCGQAAVRRGVVHVQDHDRSRRAMISRIISDVPEAMGQGARRGRSARRGTPACTRGHRASARPDRPRDWRLGRESLAIETMATHSSRAWSARPPGTGPGAPPRSPWPSPRSVAQTCFCARGAPKAWRSRDRTPSPRAPAPRPTGRAPRP